VQVKSCFSPERPGYTGFPIVAACHWGRGKLAYSTDQIDFIAAFIAKHDAWYLIPVEKYPRISFQLKSSSVRAATTSAIAKPGTC
jgi:hypothetical protein